LFLSISQASTILSEFNDTEPDMEKLETHTSKEAAWRSRLQRQAQSGKPSLPSVGCEYTQHL
jgi:hypothetical protein